jgi:hypothetical protein
MHDLGSDIDGHTIANKWENKGQFIAWFKYYVRPLHYEFAEVFFHKREQFCIPEIVTCNASPGYPAQNYDSCLPTCPLPATWPYEIEPLSASGDEAITPPAAGLGAPLVDTPMTFPPGVVGASGTGNPPDQ